MSVVATYASTRNTQILSTELYIKGYDFDPDATTATDIGWIDFSKYESAIFSFFRTVGTSNLTMKVIANTASDGSGTDDYVIKAVTFTAEPNALGDNAFVEITADEVAYAAAQAGVALRYVSLSLAVATATDEGVATYICKPKTKAKGTTSDIIA